MSYQNESKELIEAFKEEVKKKLPIWLKTQVTELKDFLDELEDHIWDKVTELAEGKDPDIFHVREAIKSMGTPRKIAKEFRTRGTPKFYITEELWPPYYKGLIFACVFILFVNMLTMGIKLAQPGAVVGSIVGKAFEGTFAGFAYAIVGITLVFVQLSYHGFLPEDFKKFTEDQDKKKEKTREKRKRSPRTKSVIPSTGSYLFEGIMGFVIGGVLGLYPFGDITFLAEHMPALPGWLKYVGLVMIFSGVIRFSQALIGKHVRLQQLFLSLGIIPMCFNLALLLQLHFNEYIIRKGFIYLFPTTDVYTIIYALVIVFSILSVVGMLGEIRKIAQLELKGFEPKETKFEKLMNNH